ncbi:MAG: hypothetical protein O2807_07480 [bacterium]|nr:hypothetical protein [bacterium]
MNFIKQCGYCFRLMDEDGKYHQLGLDGTISCLQVGTTSRQEVPITHGICSDCFQKNIAKLHEPERKKERISDGMLARLDSFLHGSSRSA